MARQPLSGSTLNTARNNPVARWRRYVGMIATTSIYLVGSSQNVCRSPTFGFAGKIQVDVPLTTNVTSIKVHIRSEPTKAYFDPSATVWCFYSGSPAWEIRTNNLRRPTRKPGNSSKAFASLSANPLGTIWYPSYSTNLA
jgi:hypothetical protein